MSKNLTMATQNAHTIQRFIFSKSAVTQWFVCEQGLNPALAARGPIPFQQFMACNDT